MARKVKSKKKVVKEPKTVYKKSSFRIFHSFEEQAQYELEKMATRTGIESLRLLRRCINVAFMMHGYNPAKLPKKHKLKITGYI